MAVENDLDTRDVLIGRTDRGRLRELLPGERR